MLERRGGETRRNLEDRWRTKLLVAHERYREAAAQAKSVREEEQQGLLPSVDGFHAVSKALQEENAALREYMRVLEAFNELVIHDKLPPQE